MADKMLSKYARYCDTACWKPHWKAGESRFKPTSPSYCPDLPTLPYLLVCLSRGHVPHAWTHYGVRTDRASISSYNNSKVVGCKAVRSRETRTRASDDKRQPRWK